MPRLAKFRLESHNNWSEGSPIENHLAVLEHHANKPDTLSLFSSRVSKAISKYDIRTT